MRLRGLVNQVRYRHERFTINSNAQLGYARDLNISPKWAPTWIAVPKEQCRTILPKGLSDKGDDDDGAIITSPHWRPLD